MYVPTYGSRSEKVCILIAERSSLTCAQIKALLPKLTDREVGNAITRLRRKGAVEQVNGKGGAYTLNKYLAGYYSDVTSDPIDIEPEPIKPEIVQPRTPNVFRALQPKNIPSLDARRDDAGPVRKDFGLKNGSTDFRSFVGYVLKG